MDLGSEVDDFQVESDASSDYGDPPSETAASEEEGGDDFSLVTVASFATKAEAKIYMFTSCQFRTQVKHTSSSIGRRQTVYKCKTHVNCEFLLYMIVRPTEAVIATRGRHGKEEAECKPHGIHKRFIDEADNLLRGGAGPDGCIKKLRVKYKSEINLQKMLPAPTQLKMRKQYMKTGRDIEGKVPWEIKTLAHLVEWAADRMAPSKESFFGLGGIQSAFDFSAFNNESDGFRHEMFVLDCFSHSVLAQDDGHGELSFGLVVSSRHLLRNAVGAILGQPGELLAVADGTYNIHFGGWTLSSVGSCGVHRARNEYSRSYTPWAYIFVRSESSLAYASLFRAVKLAVRDYFELELHAVFGCLDHAAPIALAFEEVWPGIVLLGCWPHLTRKAEEKARSMGCHDFFANIVRPALDSLHEARSALQFESLARLHVPSWDNKEYASWFSGTYLHPRWSKWFLTASKCGGVLPNQNPIESHHRAIKATSLPGLRAATTVVLNETLPTVVFQLKKVEIYRHYCVGPIPAEIIVAAEMLLKPANHRRVNSVTNPPRLVGIVFNCRKNMVKPTNLQSLKVDHHRVRVFLRSLEGKLQADDVVQNAELRYLSLHQVEVLEQGVSVSHSLNQPVWSLEEIQTIRSKYRCDCMGFYSTGWICSHVAAALSMEDGFPIRAMLEEAPARKPPGRPKLCKGGLERGVRPAVFFSESHLESLFLRQPGYPIHWNVLHEFPTRAGHQERIPGSIRSMVDKNGVYFWKIKFDNGKVLELGCQDLVAVVLFSKRNGITLC